MLAVVSFASHLEKEGTVGFLAPTSHPISEHFGEQLRASKFGHKMTRELYAYPNRKPQERPKREMLGERWWEATVWKYRDEEHTHHSDAHLLVQRDAAPENFDL